MSAPGRETSDHTDAITTLRQEPARDQALGGDLLQCCHGVRLPEDVITVLDSDENVTGADDDDCPLTESMRPLGEAAAAWTWSRQAVASQARHHTPHLNTPQH